MWARRARKVLTSLGGGESVAKGCANDLVRRGGGGPKSTLSHNGTQIEKMFAFTCILYVYVPYMPYTFMLYTYIRRGWTEPEIVGGVRERTN